MVPVDEAIGERGNVAHMDGVERQGTTGAQLPQGQRHQLSSGGKDDPSIQRTRGRVFGCPYPGGAELLGMAAMSLGTGEDKDFAAPMARHLNGKMSAGPKSEQSQALTGVHIGQAQGAKD